MTISRDGMSLNLYLRRPKIRFAVTCGPAYVVVTDGNGEQSDMSTVISLASKTRPPGAKRRSLSCTRWDLKTRNLKSPSSQT